MEPFLEVDSMDRHALALFGALVLLAGPTSGEVFHVNHLPGPGVDFTDLPPAVAAAAPGDSILVSPGEYSATVLTKGLTIRGLGSTYATVIHSISIHDLPSKQVVLLVDVRIRGISIDSCAGTVLFHGVDATTSTYPALQPMHVVDARDVRVYGSAFARAGFTSTLLPAVDVYGSRLEVVHSSIYGQQGMDAVCSGCQNGDVALYLRDASRGLVVRPPHVQGGSGGNQEDDCIQCGSQNTGDGAPAIVVEGGSELVLTGQDTDVIRGGDAGRNLDPYFEFCDCTGDPAPCIVSSAQVFWSGVHLTPGIEPDCGHTAPTISGPATQLPSIAYLEVQPPAAPDGPYRFVAHGTPGATVELVLGTDPVLEATSGVAVERLVSEIRRISMGTISPNGNVTKLVPFPFEPLVDARVFAQAELSGAGGLDARTNSVLVYLRH